MKFLRSLFRAWRNRNRPDLKMAPKQPYSAIFMGPDRTQHSIVFPDRETWVDALKQSFDSAKVGDHP